MNQFKFYIPKRLPGLNEIIAASKVSFGNFGRKGANAYQYTILKRNTENYAINWIKRELGGVTPIRPLFEECKIDFVWIEENRRRDPSNVCAGGRKFILDALVKCRVLKNDNWLVKDFTDTFIVDKRQAGVQVTINSKN